MYEPLRNRMLALLKVPAEPHPPLGDPASLRVFRAGRNYYRLKMAGWSAAQVAALVGILFWTGVLVEVERQAQVERTAPAAPQTSANATVAPTAGSLTSPATTRNRKQRFQQWQAALARNVGAAARESANPSPFARGWAAGKQVCVEIARVSPPWVFPLVWAFKVVGFLVYFVQLVATYAVRRLDYEMRWYLVTDRSLRLRHGIWVVWESTMSFANLQQVVISQGPLQRLLGLADVKVQSAGGGTPDREHAREDMHVGYFHCVTNAAEIRDLILERLRRFRESGLGDPDEKARVMPPETSVPMLAAAHEFAAEARTLRSVIAAK